MVKGLAHFLKHFSGYHDRFILIGGAACELWMTGRGLEFRATKDLDIVLVDESLPLEFFQRFWAFVKEGRYESHHQSETRPSFYRFRKPANSDHPFMVELFSRNFLEIPGDVHLTPIPAGGVISSLSAILLGDDYFNFIVSSRALIDGVPTVPVQCLIPLKARAYLDLIERQATGATVDSKDVRKHRNDVFRLYLTLAPADRFPLPAPLAGDLSRFLQTFQPDSKDWPAILDAVKGLPEPQQVVDQLQKNFSAETQVA